MSDDSFVLADDDLALDPDVLAGVPPHTVDSLEEDVGHKKSMAQDIIDQV